jgi:hypothetical protein
MEEDTPQRHGLGLGTSAMEDEPTEDCRRSARVHKPTQRLIEIMETEIMHASPDVNGEIFSYRSLYPRDDSSLKRTH